MQVVRVSAKSQVVIPAALRKKAGLKPGGQVLVSLNSDGRILLEPAPDDPIEAFCGMLKGGPSVREIMARNRQEEYAREAKKSARFLRGNGPGQARTGIRKG